MLENVLEVGGFGDYVKFLVAQQLYMSSTKPNQTNLD